ncbi:MAG: hypothetical protein ACHQE5_10465 [Actinomycetes bacterium]
MPRRRLFPSVTPAQVRAVVGPGERVLAWTMDATGRPVAASTAALYLPAVDDLGGGHERLAYETVAAATWDEPTLEIVTVGPSRRRFSLTLDEPGLLPQTVRDRVTASIVVSEHVPLIGSAGARITARRPLVGPGEVSWNVVFDQGLDPGDPQLREAADAAIAYLQAATGL